VVNRINVIYVVVTLNVLGIVLEVL